MVKQQSLKLSICGFKAHLTHHFQHINNMSKREDKERFNNLITTGSYATNDELGSFMGMALVLGLVVGVLYGIHWLCTK